MKIEDGFFKAVFSEVLPKKENELFAKRIRHEVVGKLVEAKDKPLIKIDACDRPKNLKLKDVKNAIWNHLGY
jgi:hypothetical protein